MLGVIVLWSWGLNALSLYILLLHVCLFVGVEEGGGGVPWYSGLG